MATAADDAASGESTPEGSHPERTAADLALATAFTDLDLEQLLEVELAAVEADSTAFSRPQPESERSADGEMAAAIVVASDFFELELVALLQVPVTDEIPGQPVEGGDAAPEQPLAIDPTPPAEPLNDATGSANFAPSGTLKESEPAPMPEPERVETYHAVPTPTGPDQGSGSPPTNASFASGGSVAENAGNGTTVGAVTATDPDAGAVLAYSLSDDAGGRFAIDAMTGVVTVADGSLLDYEAGGSHSITVLVSDGTYTTSAMLNVTVADANEAPGAVSDGGSDNLYGGDGDDVLQGGPGVDALFGEAGNDTLIWYDLEPTIDGGAGIDTLRVGTGSVDFTANAGNFASIEIIDLAHWAAANTVTLSAADILAESDTDTITILGSNADTANIGAGWSDGGVSGGYHTYTQSGATLIVDVDLMVTFT